MAISAQALHRNLSFCQVNDPSLHSLLVADETVSSLLVAQFENGWLVFRRSDEEAFRARLATLGLRPRIKGRWS